jgi:hypothetical protein
LATTISLPKAWDKTWDFATDESRNGCSCDDQTQSVQSNSSLTDALEERRKSLVQLGICSLGGKNFLLPRANTKHRRAGGDRTHDRRIMRWTHSVGSVPWCRICPVLNENSSGGVGSVRWCRIGMWDFPWDFLKQPTPRPRPSSTLTLRRGQRHHFSNLCS